MKKSNCRCEDEILSSIMKKLVFNVIFVSLAVVYLLICCGSVLGADYYVAVNGRDTNPGTLSAPWQTVAKANSSLQPGDTAFFRAGVYDGTIAPVNSGTAGNFIAYKAYPGEKPVLDRSRSLTDWEQVADSSVYWAAAPQYASGVWEDTYSSSGDYYSYWPMSGLEQVDGPGKYFYDKVALRIYVWTKAGDNPAGHIMRTSVGNGGGFSSKDYVSIEGLKFQWVQNGLKLNACNYCRFQDLEINYAAGYGVYFQSQSNYNIVSANNISCVGAWFWNGGDGVYVNGHHNLIDGNSIFVCGHNAINSNGKSSDNHHNIIQNNRLHMTRGSGCGANFNTNREVWRNNVVYDCTGYGMQIDSSNVIVNGNVFYNCNAGIVVYTTDGRTIAGGRIYNNTLCGNTHVSKSGSLEVYDIGIHEYAGTCVNNVFKNNISCKPGSSYQAFIETAAMTGNIFVSNDFFNEANVSIRSKVLGVKALSAMQPQYMQDNLEINPLMVDAANHNYLLQSDSTMVDAGCFLTTALESGMGSSIKVADAGYFCDGFGLVPGDTVQLAGATTRLKVLSADYDGNVIVIDKPVAYERGVGIAMAFYGSAPDIGAYELFIEKPTLEKPKNLRIPQ
ncbi:MAG: right-handed parallel beta-helix repeat-containing protein [Deltaproteobacteria bacterium]|nr:right-handed parallel beta-helix repeat-containing protein [Deltaproteobacteria bacterium]